MFKDLAELLFNTVERPFDSYYGRLVLERRDGAAPHAREAQRDYLRLVGAQLKISLY